MLGLLGLIGIVFAGIVADIAISQASGPEEDAPDEDLESRPASESESPGTRDLLDWAEPGTRISLEAGRANTCPEPEAITDGFPEADVPDILPDGRATVDLPKGKGGADASDMVWISDYDAAQDEIVVLYDVLAHPDPVVTLEPVEGSEDVTVLLDGVPLAQVQGGAGLDPSMIRLATDQQRAA